MGALLAATGVPLGGCTSAWPDVSGVGASAPASLRRHGPSSGGPGLWRMAQHRHGRRHKHAPKDGQSGGLEALGPELPILALSASSVDLRRWPSTRQLHRRLEATNRVTSGCWFGPALVRFRAPQLASKVAVYLGCHRRLGQLLLLHMWTSTSPFQGKNI